MPQMSREQAKWLRHDATETSRTRAEMAVKGHGVPRNRKSARKNVRECSDEHPDARKNKTKLLSLQPLFKHAASLKHLQRKGLWMEEPNEHHEREEASPENGAKNFQGSRKTNRLKGA